MNMIDQLRRIFKKAPWSFYVTSTIIYLIIFFVFIDRVSLDYIIGFDVWYRAILYQGLGVLKQDFYNYAPAYMYLIAFSTLLPVKSLWAIKFMALPVVPLAGYFMARIVSITARDDLKTWLAYTLTLLAPTILINASYWGQADIFYGTASLACLSFLIRKRPYAAMIACGVAIAFKAQAVFLGPFLLLLLIKKQIPWKSVFIPPLIFLLSGLPVFLLGKPIYDILFVYFKQASTFQLLCMNCSSLWALFPGANYDVWVLAGFALTIVVIVVYLIVAYFNVNVENPAHLLLAATLSVILMPFFLPKMLDRYFYLAELFSIGLVFVNWRYLVIPVLLQVSAANLYWLALRRKGFLFPVEGSSLMTLTAVSLLAWFFWRQIRPVREKQDRAIAENKPGGF